MSRARRRRVLGSVDVVFSGGRHVACAVPLFAADIPCRRTQATIGHLLLPSRHQLPTQAIRLFMMRSAHRHSTNPHPRRREGRWSGHRAITGSSGFSCLQIDIAFWHAAEFGTTTFDFPAVVRHGERTPQDKAAHRRTSHRLESALRAACPCLMSREWLSDSTASGPEESNPTA